MFLGLHQLGEKPSQVQISEDSGNRRSANDLFSAEFGLQEPVEPRRTQVFISADEAPTTGRLRITIRITGRSYSAAKPLMPIHKCASSCRFFLYVRVTVYSLPPRTQITYSPVAQGWISSTRAAFTSADR